MSKVWITDRTQIMDLIIGLFLLYLVLDPINCESLEIEKLTIIPDSPEFVHFVDDARFVTCRGNKVKWIKPNGKPLNETKGRVHVEERDSNTLLLMFEIIDKNVHGNWTCVSETDNIQKHFTMKVFVPISFEGIQEIQDAQEEKDATIQCKVKGMPEPKISWYFNGQQIIFPNNRYKLHHDGLLIKKVSRNETGEYTCKAFQISDAISNVEEQTIKLNVQHKPFSRKKTLETVFAYPSGNVNLTCEVEALPPASFIWYRHGKKISAKDFPIFNETHVSFLNVYIQTNSSYGEYKCKAMNKLGNVEHVINLIPGTKPERPRTFFLRGVNSDTLDIDVGAKRDTNRSNEMAVIGYRFECIAVKDYETKSGWKTARRIDFQIEDGVTYLLTQLAQNTRYYVRVASRNRAGLSDFTETELFSTLPIIPHKTSAGSTLMPSIFLIIMHFLLIGKY